jgi:hypothetical protein
LVVVGHPDSKVKPNLEVYDISVKEKEYQEREVTYQSHSGILFIAVHIWHFGEPPGQRKWRERRFCASN